MTSTSFVCIKRVAQVDVSSDWFRCVFYRNNSDRLFFPPISRRAFSDYAAHIFAQYFSNSLDFMMWRNEFFSSSSLRVNIFGREMNCVRGKKSIIIRINYKLIASHRIGTTVFPAFFPDKNVTNLHILLVIISSRSFSRAFFSVVLTSIFCCVCRSMQAVWWDSTCIEINKASRKRWEWNWERAEQRTKPFKLMIKIAGFGATSIFRPFGMYHELRVLPTIDEWMSELLYSQIDWVERQLCMALRLSAVEKSRKTPLRFEYQSQGRIVFA